MKKPNLLDRFIKLILHKPISILYIKFKYNCTLKQSVDIYKLFKKH
jgi:hypothetical protein